MSKTPKKRVAKTRTARPITAQPTKPTETAQSKDAKERPKPTSKQSRVVEMLRSPAGATITAVMKATGWQQHSVRGFLAGIVRKKLGLKLSSETSEGGRVYRILGSQRVNPGPSKRKQAN